MDLGRVLKHGLFPFIDRVKEGLREALRLKISKALVLAAQGTIELKLYEHDRLRCIYPSEEDQRKVNLMIREVAGGVMHSDQAIILKKIIAHNYKRESIDGVILACTELPLIHQKFPLDQKSEEYPSLQVVDTIKVLAKRLIELAHSVSTHESN